MEFKEGTTGGESNYNSSGETTLTGIYTVRQAPAYSDEEGEKAYGVYASNVLLGVFWNEEFANIFKDAMKNVEVKVTR